MNPSVHQLTLALGRKRRIRLDDFIPGDNHPALTALESTLNGKGELLLYFWGRPATGKSHLLLGACDRLASQRRRPAYLSLADPRRLPPTALEQFDHLDLICIDNLEGIVGHTAWEQTLFDLFNRLRASRKPLLFAASAPPNELPIRLPDLKSRLTWGAVFHLTPPDDLSRQQALIAGASRIGMTLTPQAANYLLRHYSRDLSQLFDFLDRLDTVTLETKSQPTIPLLKQLIAAHPAETERVDHT